MTTRMHSDASRGTPRMEPEIYRVVQDEGVALPQEIALNFTGGGVTATDDAANNRTNVNIPLGGGLNPPANPAENNMICWGLNGNLSYGPQILTDGTYVGVGATTASIAQTGAGRFDNNTSLNWRDAAGAADTVVLLYDNADGVTLRAGVAATGGAANLLAGAATAGVGGAVNITAGAGAPANAGGAVNITSGAGTGGAASGTITLQGAAQSVGGNGGAIALITGAATAGVSGAVTITTADNATAGSGVITLTAGSITAAVASNCGDISLLGGDTIGTGAGSSIIITAGASTGGVGGDVAITTPNNAGTATGSIRLVTGTVGGVGGGAIDIATGGAAGAGGPGRINISTGASTNAAGGSINISSGTTTGAVGNNITIRVGSIVAVNANNCDPLLLLGGDTVGTGRGSDVYIRAGVSTGGGTNGEIILQSGAGTEIGRFGAGYLQLGTNPAVTGIIRLPNNTSVNWRDAANAADTVVLLYDNADGVTLRAGVAATGGAANLLAGAATAGVGGAVNITAGAGGGANAGGAVNITSGAGTGGAASGTITLQGAAHPVGGTGGAIALITGTAAAGVSGAVTITTADNATAGSGVITLTAGSITAAVASNCGDISLLGGDTIGTGAGSSIIVTAGSSSGGGTNGAITLLAGGGAGAVPIAGGAINITAGAGVANAVGGAINLLAGVGAGAAAGGAVNITAGAATSTGGGISLLTGVGGGPASGAITLTTADSTTGSPGALTLTVGSITAVVASNVGALSLLGGDTLGAGRASDVYIRAGVSTGGGTDGEIIMQSGAGTEIGRFGASYMTLGAAAGSCSTAGTIRLPVGGSVYGLDAGAADRAMIALVADAVEISDDANPNGVNYRTGASHVFSIGGVTQTTITSTGLEISPAGAAVSAVGTIRMPKNGTVYVLDNGAANTRLIGIVTDTIYIGDDTNPAGIVYETGTGTHSWEIGGTVEAVIGTGYLAIGTTPAASGIFRLPNNAGAVSRNAGDTADINLIRANGADRVLVGGTTGYDTLLSLAGTANLAIGTMPAAWQAMTHGVFVSDATAAPTGNPVAGGYLYSNAGAGTWRGSGGTITTFGPAEPHCPRCGRDWVLAAENPGLGWKKTLCLHCMVEALDRAGVPRNDYMVHDVERQAA